MPNGITPGGKVKDHMMFVVGGHVVMHDRLQMVLQHPITCPGKGSPMDHRKTFHRWPAALKKLDECHVPLSNDQLYLVRDKGIEVNATPR